MLDVHRAGIDPVTRLNTDGRPPRERELWVPEVLTASAPSICPGALLVVVSAEHDVGAGREEAAVRRAPIGEPDPPGKLAGQHVVMERRAPARLRRGALAKIAVDPVGLRAGRCPFTAMSRMFQVREPSATP